MHSVQKWGVIPAGPGLIGPGPIGPGPIGPRPGGGGPIGPGPRFPPIGPGPMGPVRFFPAVIRIAAVAERPIYCTAKRIGRKLMQKAPYTKRERRKKIHPPHLFRIQNRNLTIIPILNPLTLFYSSMRSLPRSLFRCIFSATYC